MTTATAPLPTTGPDTGPAGDHIQAGTWWGHTLVYAGRNLAHVRQIPEKLFDVTIQPVMFVMLFAYVFGGAIDVGAGSYREFLVGGILIQSLAFGLVGPATAMATDLTEGVIDRFRSLPAARSSYLAGHFLAELAAMCLAITIMLVTGYVVGWRVHTDLLHVGVALVLLLAFASAMIAVGTYIGLLVRTPDAVMGVAFPTVFPITFISAAFVPIGTMPTVLEHVAAWNPVTTLVAAVRELFGNPQAPTTVSSWPLDRPVLAGFAYCAAILAVMVPLCLRRYRARTTD
jgi:ABC-2 type transport system permease protein